MWESRPCEFTGRLPANVKRLLSRLEFLHFLRTFFRVADVPSGPGLRAL
jgi:hypothetical protein